MFGKLIILFIAIPILELYVLLEVGEQVGVFSTLLLIITTGIAGAWLTRLQGFELFQRIQLEMNQGRVPAEEMLDAMMIFMGGLVLLTPGFVTDLMGFVFLVPQTRAWLKKRTRGWLTTKVERGEIKVYRR